MSENKVGIIIIDMWNNHAPSYPYFTELIEHCARNIGILLDNTLGNPNLPVANACYVLDPPGGPHPALRHRCLPNDRRDNSNRIFSTNVNQIIELFKKNNVNTICYAGKSLPGCVEVRQVGIENLGENFKIKIIADCTLDLYNSHKHDYDRINEMYRYMQKKNYEYIFSTDIINQFRKQNEN